MEKKENKKESTTFFGISASANLKQTVLGLAHFVLCIYALYLSFKCNNGFDFGGFLMACCCPYLYIPYKLATTCGVPAPRLNNLRPRTRF